MPDFRKPSGTVKMITIRKTHRQKSTAKLVLLGFLSTLSFFANPLQAEDGAAENIAIQMSSEIVHSPVAAATTRRVVQGAIVDYSIAVAGPSVGASPPTFFVLKNPIPDEMALFVGDLGNVGSGPVAFVETDSGVSYRFEGLTSGSDALAFSNNGGKSFDYVPVGDTEGYDNRVTHIRIVPIGALMSTNGRHTRFSVRYRARVK